METRGFFYLRDNWPKSALAQNLVPNSAPSPWRANYTAAGNFQKAVPGYRDLVPLGSQVNALEKRWCLSERSELHHLFSSLAVACKPRGTFPESHKHCFLKVPCPANQLKLHENSYFSRKCLTRRNSYVTMFGRMEDIGLFFMLKKR